MGLVNFWRHLAELNIILNSPRQQSLQGAVCISCVFTNVL